MRMSAGDVLDRLSIVLLKFRNGVRMDREMEPLMDSLLTLMYRNPDVDWMRYLYRLYEVNEKIWALEAAVRNGMLDKDLEEVGRRAVEIRNLNRERVGIRNEVNFLAGESVHEVKKDHGSE